MLSLLVKNHLGSIAGSAFMHGILYFPDMFIDFFIPEKRPEKPEVVEGRKEVKPRFNTIGYNRI